MNLHKNSQSNDKYFILIKHKINDLVDYTTVYYIPLYLCNILSEITNKILHCLHDEIYV